jgi:EmrB/QacA subfamily drug resistance transporter
VSEPVTAALSHRQIMVVFSGLMSGSLIAALDQNIVATALPRMVSDLGGLSHISWVVTAYLLTTTISTPLYGKLGDLFGRKRLFQIAIVIFVFGSVLSGAAQTMGQLIAFRGVQGLGAGGIIVGAQAIIGDILAPAERGRYQGYTGSVWAGASIIGPFIGGFFTQHLSWRWAFYINVPIGAVALCVTAVVLRLPERREAPKIDWWGAALLSAGVASLVLLTTWGASNHAWSSPRIVGLAVATAAFLTAFGYVERRALDPVLPGRLFRVSVFRISVLMSVIVGFAVIGTTTFIPLYLQVVDGASPVEAGVKMTPIMVSLVLASIVSGRTISRRGRYRLFPIAGTILMAIGLLLLSFMTAHTGYLVQAMSMAVLGLGMGMVIQVLILTAQNSVSPRDLGVATSTVTFARSIGASTGVAFFGAIFSERLASNLRAAGGDQLSGLASGLTPAALTRLDPAARAALVDSFASALHLVYLCAVPVALIGIVASLYIKEQPLRVRVVAAVVVE